MAGTEEDGGFVGRVAFVTGAASGIGRATAVAFAREGAKVVVADVSPQGNQETASMIEELGGQAIIARCDVTSSEDVKAALDQGIEAFGRLDVAFNNAGIEQPVAATADIGEEEGDRIVDVNLRGVFVCMKHEIPLLLRYGRERVLAQEPVGRMGTPEEIAAAVFSLCSDAAAFVTGHAMVIDCGQTIGLS